MHSRAGWSIRGARQQRDAPLPRSLGQLHAAAAGEGKYAGRRRSRFPCAGASRPRMFACVVSQQGRRMLPRSCRDLHPASAGKSKHARRRGVWQVPRRLVPRGAWLAARSLHAGPARGRRAGRGGLERRLGRPRRPGRLRLRRRMLRRHPRPACTARTAGLATRGAAPCCTAHQARAPAMPHGAVQAAHRMHAAPPSKLALHSASHALLGWHAGIGVEGSRLARAPQGQAPGRAPPSGSSRSRYRPRRARTRPAGLRSGGRQARALCRTPARAKQCRGLPPRHARMRHA